MGDRAGRAARRAARLENQGGVDVDIRRDVDGGDSGSGSSDDERVEEVVGCLVGGLNHLERFRRWLWTRECGLTWSMLNHHILSIWRSRV